MKKEMRILSTLFLLLIFNQSAIAQESITSDSLVLPLSLSDCSCCSKPYAEFDFWKGDWSVVDTQGSKVGDNRITKIEENCILKEEWSGVKGSSGTSINFYNKVDSTWNQTWVDNQGNVLELKGGLVNENMILKSKILKGKKKEYYHQITWTPNKDGTVTQLWEQYDANGKLWQTLFKGVYHRKKDD